MNLSHFIATAVIASISCVGAAAAPSVFPARMNRPAVNSVSRSSASPLTSAFDMTLPGGKAGWYPEKIVSQTYEYDAQGWITTATSAMEYDEGNRVASVDVSLPAPTGSLPAYFIALGYGSEKSVLPDTVTVTAFGNPQIQYHVTYDGEVNTYPVKIESRTMLDDGDWSDWAVALDVEVKRDAKGRVTSVEPKVMKINDLPIEYEKLEITYATGEYPVAITSYSVDTDDSGRVKFEDMVRLTDMEFEECNNQILALTDLYKAPNRLTSCNMTDDDECNLKMTFTYGERNSYVASSTGIEDGVPVVEKLEMTYTDNYGSYTMTRTTQYSASGYFDEEFERVVYNEFGLIAELESYEDSTDPSEGVTDEDVFVKGETDYFEKTGLPCEYVRSVKVDGTDLFAPVMRQLFDGYEPSSGINAPAVSTENTAKGIFTIDGRRLPEGSVPAPGFYIINGIKTLVR